MATKNRSDLKSYFVKNAIPTEGNFADLIDSQLNQAQDGVFKPDGEALSVTAAPGDQKRVLRLYASYPALNPDWMINLNPAQDPANAAMTSKPGFGITDSTGKTRLFIDAATGNIGMGTNTPEVALEVTGAMRASRFRPRYDTVLNDYQTVNPPYGVGLEGSPGDSDTWIYRAPMTSDNSNWGIYHREINTAITGLPGNSIGFVGGGTSKLQAYVSLADGSGFFAGDLTVSGQITAGGGVQGSGSRIQYDTVLNDYQTVNPSSNVCLPGPPSDRDAWIYRDSDTSSNWGIYHRHINTEVAGLPGNSIGFVGGGTSKLQAYVNLADGSGYFSYLRFPNETPKDKIVMWDNGPTDRSGIGLNGSEINLFCPAAGVFALRQNSATGTRVFTVTGAGTARCYGPLILKSADDASGGIYFPTPSGGVPCEGFLRHSVVPGTSSGSLGGKQSQSAQTAKLVLGINGLGATLVLWQGSERLIISNTDVTIRVGQGRWVFQEDGNLVKYRNDGSVVWSLDNSKGGAGW